MDRRICPTAFTTEAGLCLGGYVLSVEAAECTADCTFTARTCISKMRPSLQVRVGEGVVRAQYAVPCTTSICTRRELHHVYRVEVQLIHCQQYARSVERQEDTTEASTRPNGCGIMQDNITPDAIVHRYDLCEAHQMVCRQDQTRI